MRIKARTKVVYTFAAGKIVEGVVLRQHKGDMIDWYVVRMTDERGSFSGSCHVDQLRVTDNRPERTVP